MKKLIFTIIGLAIVSIFALQVNLSAQVLDGGSNNTGPGKLVTCTDGGQKKLCMAENHYACTESDCF